MKRLIVTFVSLFLLALPHPVLAWNKAGHMITGAIAYSDLQTNDPQALQKVISILKEHPEFNSRWASQLAQIGIADQDLYLFMLAARWPDDIRGDDDYDHPTWHYINIPFKPDGQPDSVVTRQPDPENILTAIQENLDILASNASDEDKAVALCWLFHLYGDIHQPLHTTALFTTQFPEGDRGGTRFYIKVKPMNRSTISLHKFWDDLVGRSQNLQTVRNRATQLRLSNDRSTLPELADTNFQDWAKPESYEISVRDAYKNGTLKGSTDKQDGEVLPADYASTVQPLAEKQVTLSGYRISDELKKLF